MPGELLTVPLGVAGPIARSAADLELALDVLAGPSELDGTGWRLDLPPARHERLGDFRVGVWLGGEGYRVDGAYREAIEGFVSEVAAVGARVSRVGAAARLRASGTTSSSGRCSRSSAARLPMSRRRSPRSPRRRDRLRGACLACDRDLARRVVRAARAARAHVPRVPRLLRRRRRAPLPGGDGGGIPARHRGERRTALGPADRRLEVDGEALPYFDNFTWPGLATCANLPSTVMPTGRFVDGLPAGVQIVGPYLEDRTTLRFARLVEAVLGGFTAPPAVED